MTDVTLISLDKRIDGIQDFFTNKFNYLDNLMRENLDDSVKRMSRNMDQVSSDKVEVMRMKEVVLSKINKFNKDLELITKFIHDLGKLTYDLDVFKPDPVEEKKKISILEKQLELANKKIANYETKIKSILKD